MATIIDPPNSVWPNGLKVDSEGYVTFYPLGTNKIDINTITWPDGDTLISPFVYQNDKLVGFVDTKALTVSGSAATTMNYSHIEADFSSIVEGTLTVDAPNATVKKFRWSVSIGGDDNTIVTIKYKGCKNVDDVKAIDPDYKTNDIVDGVWDEGLGDLTNGIDMFRYCSNLTAFSSDLSSLTDGRYMFFHCENLTTFSSDLPSLANGGYMFSWCTNLTSFTPDLSNLTMGEYMFNWCTNLTSFSSDLSSLTDGRWMFYHCENLTSFDSDLSSLTNGDSMFSNCGFTSFTSDLSSLTNGGGMFQSCSKLTSFTSDLPSMENGNSMFNYCTKLNSYSSDLSKLTNGYMMFYHCSQLETFSSDLPSLTSGQWMFQDCYNLTTFDSDLSSLTNGFQMFDDCSELTSFTSDLSSLTNGDGMFYGCKLDTTSVQNIADTIKDVKSLENGSGECSDIWKYIYIGIGNSEPNGQEESAFNTMVSKGWTVYVNGSKYSPTSPAAITTLDETGEETVTPIPYWAKSVQTDEEHAQYVDAQGNFFNILGGQFIYGDDLSTYGMFTCEADAAANMRLTPYIKTQTEIEKN